MKIAGDSGTIGGILEVNTTGIHVPERNTIVNVNHFTVPLATRTLLGTTQTTPAPEDARNTLSILAGQTIAQGLHLVINVSRCVGEGIITTPCRSLGAPTNVVKTRIAGTNHRQAVDLRGADVVPHAIVGKIQGHAQDTRL